jgi:hypothetical protein
MMLSLPGDLGSGSPSSARLHRREQAQQHKRFALAAACGSLALELQMQRGAAGAMRCNAMQLFAGRRAPVGDPVADPGAGCIQRDEACNHFGELETRLAEVLAARSREQAAVTGSRLQPAYWLRSDLRAAPPGLPAGTWRAACG